MFVLNWVYICELLSQQSYLFPFAGEFSDGWLCVCNEGSMIVTFAVSLNICTVIELI
jgi:hypothetical protein